MENENFDTVYVDTTTSTQETPKSKAAAGVLAILLGTYGVHNFYLGYYKKAAIQLSITVGSILLMIIGTLILTVFTIVTMGIGSVLFPFLFILIAGPFAVQVWSLIEGVQILSGQITVDGKGNPIE